VAVLATWGAVARLDRWTEETRREWKASGRVYVLDTRTGVHLPLDVALLDDFEANRERLDVLAAARELEVPWLLVHGVEDLTVPVEEGRELARASGRARLVEVEDAGHTFEVDHPFEGPTPALDRALEVTVAHFLQHLPL